MGILGIWSLPMAAARQLFQPLGRIRRLGLISPVGLKLFTRPLTLSCGNSVRILWKRFLRGVVLRLAAGLISSLLLGILYVIFQPLRGSGRESCGRKGTGK